MVNRAPERRIDMDAFATGSPDATPAQSPGGGVPSALLFEQQAFVLALIGRGQPPEGLRAPGARLAAYTNNLQVLSGQALAVPYGRLKGVLGEGDFAVMAWSFWRAHPPGRGDLAQWGEHLADWLIERGTEDSGLPGLARLEWALHRAERSSDASLEAESLQRLGDTDPAALKLRLRPGVALVELSSAAWALLDGDGEPPAGLTGSHPGEGAIAAGVALVWRRGWRGVWQRLEAADAALMTAVLEGQSLDAALTQAQAAACARAPSEEGRGDQPPAVKGSATTGDYDLAGWLARALNEGWLQSVEVLDPTSCPESCHECPDQNHAPTDLRPRSR